MKIKFFDGSMGTLLQAQGLKKGEAPDLWNLTNPDKVLSVHNSYAEAGSEFITTNTFGANRLRFDNTEKIVRAGIEIAKSAGRKVALDLGPTGKLLKPMGELDFEETVDIYSEVVGYGKSDADVIIIETVSDTYEMKAALLAAKENSDLPVIASYIFDESGRLLTGADVKTAAVIAESLGADIIGVNCGFGPEQFISLVKQLRKYSSLPIIAQPNAGLPESVNGKTVYNLTPDEYARKMSDIASLGVSLLGGCCGTTPEHIKKTIELCSAIEAVENEKKEISIVSSFSHSIELSKKPVVIGERLNPTGKKLMKQALIDGELNYVLKEANAQVQAGAQILDVNTGLPEIDEKQMLPEVVSAIQAVSDAPLQIDTANSAALEKAMRIYNGKPMLNSVNGKQSSMQKVFPIAKKYGAVSVCLLLDENGIPETVEGRLEIARKILNTAAEYGIDKKDLIFDALTMTVSTDSSNGLITLETVKRLAEEGLHTILGISNISFGLPNREALNTAFFTLALNSGLNAGIINPLCAPMMNAYYSFGALKGLDENFSNYINFASDTSSAVMTYSSDLKNDILNGYAEEAAKAVKEKLKNTEPFEIINNFIIPALDEAGKRFESKKMFLPQLLMSADAASAAFDEIKAFIILNGEQKAQSNDKIILATVEGDIHDIGKNIVKVLLENYGYNVIDLGKDVKCEEVLEQTKKHGAKLVGLSALMTTTVSSMEQTIKLIHENTDAAVMVGGAVLTKDYAQSINADYYAKDAMGAVKCAKEFFGRE